MELLDAVNGMMSHEEGLLTLSSALAPIKHALRPAYHRARTFEGWLRYHLGRPQPESRLEREAHRFWNGRDDRLRQFSHWQGSGIFSDADRWNALGAQHLNLYQQFARMVGANAPMRRVVEWGCGGGANAVHFAPLTAEYVGVDIAQDNLAECARQLSKARHAAFIPVLIDTAAPEDACRQVPGPCDLFIATYVFEVLPTPEYGLRVLAIAHDLLAPGGLAMIHIKYAKDDWTTQPKRFAYRHNFTTMTTYRIDQFWIEAERIGFEPKAVTLVPRQPLNGNGDYAYFLLQKRRPERKRA
jgi:SAM-dependent methyltransferase